MSPDKDSRSATAPPGERLQKFLAHAGVASRRAAEELIRSGEVTINGRMAELGDRVLPDDAVKVGNKLIQRNVVRRRLVLALNKPEGTMTTTSDPEGRTTVFDLVPAGLRSGLVAIGRLDYGTEGLLLLTNDGDLAQRVAHPRYGCTKTYRVKVRGEPDERSLDRLRRGMVLDGKRLQPATIERHRLSLTGKQRRAQKNTWWTVEIGEGRTRQVRKMFERIGHPVSRLQRVAIGPIRLGRLPKGELRELDDNEIAALERSTGKSAIERTASRRKSVRKKTADGAGHGEKKPGAKSAKKKTVRKGAADGPSTDAPKGKRNVRQRSTSEPPKPRATPKGKRGAGQPRDGARTKSGPARAPGSKGRGPRATSGSPRGRRRT